MRRSYHHAEWVYDNRTISMIGRRAEELNTAVQHRTVVKLIGYQASESRATKAEP